VSLPLNIHLEQYEGPLDLLLDLIRKQQIDIKDIPIATITAQYLDYMEKAREMDIDLGAEFVYMAATLIHIKSKMLLPRDPALEPEGETEEDPGFWNTNASRTPRKCSSRSACWRRTSGRIRR
jgi:segregation and condensation protein A